MYSTSKIDDRVYAIDEDGFVQSYVIVGENKTVLFDACNSGGEEFKNAVFALTDKPVTLVLSHSDGDHTGGQEYFGTPSMHPAEYGRYFAKGNTDRPIRPLWEGDILDLGGIKLEVVLIPGHTPGSIALLDRDSRRLFVGDSISDTHIYMFGDGRNLRAFLASLNKLEALTASFDTIHSAHGTKSLGSEWISKTKIAAEKLLAGELTGKEPERDLPCKLYGHNGVNFLY